MQLQQFKRTQRGFTLIELVVACAIVGILTAVAIPSYKNYVDNACASNVVNDIYEIETRIQRFYSSNFSLPDSLAQVGGDSLRDCWGNSYQYLRIAGANIKGKGKLRKDGADNPLNSDFDLYSAGKDGETKLPLKPKVSHDDVIRARNGAFVGIAVNY